MVSVYRDTLLDLSEGTYQKCNAAYSYGGPVMAINMLNMIWIWISRIMCS